MTRSDQPGHAAGYRDWRAVEQAIKQSAVREAQTGRGRVDEHIRLARFDRFLCRVFADREESDWLLKGGVSMLARVPATRSTSDIDLAVVDKSDLDAAVIDLARVAARDLGDHLRFDLVGTRETGLGDNQPGVRTRRLLFDCHDADTGRKLATVPIDLVVSPRPVGRVESVEPAGRLALGRPLVEHPWRLYPITDQIADKVCATMSRYGETRQPSSRVKDLVDLVVIAQTQRIDQRELQLALEHKRQLSQLAAFNHLVIPQGWAKGYTALARQVAAVRTVTFTRAVALVGELVDPALATGLLPDGMTWQPGHGWTQPPRGNR